MFSEPNINTSPLLEKGAKGKIKYFEKNHCTRLLLIPHTKYRTEQHNKDRDYFTPYQQVLLGLKRRMVFCHFLSLRILYI